MTASGDVTAIELDAVTKRYRSGGGVSDITLATERGEVFGFLGPNGAGKSTTIRLVMDLIRPDRGRISVLGLDVRRAGAEVRQAIGYLPGELALYESLTGRDMLDHLAALRGQVRSGRTVEQLAERLHLDLHKPIRELSRGNKQKVGLVQALMGHPEVVILDEPTSGLDPLIQREVRGLIRSLAEEGASVFLSSHVLSEVSEVADRVAIIRSGSLVATESVNGLRSRAARRIEVRTATPIGADAFTGIDGARIVEVEGDLTRIVVRGPMDPVVKALARFEVLDLVAGEPDLEQVFLAFYDDRPSGVSDVA